MEAVRAFNNELSGLYESKPPISRAKMATVTKTAIKAIKFYKHVVQSVEKFIQKCKPEYKVPGLYVIDSVVRQSRHQFGPHKDVFAPRFTKNIITTFQNLFKCPGDERSKIVRVLNLWQKNEVFPSEIIQPLLDLAADPTKPSLIAAAQSAVDKIVAASGKSSSSQQQQKPSGADGQNDHSAAENMLATQNDMLNTVTQLLQNTNSGSSSLDAQQQQLQQLQTLQQQLIQQTALMQQPTGGAPLIDANLLAQIQTLTNQLLQKTENKQEDGGFNKKLLDFDYGESDDEEGGRHAEHNAAGREVQTILSDKGLMQQIHQVSQTIQKNNQYSAEISERRKFLEQQQAEFDQQIAQGMQPPPPDFAEQPPMPESFHEEGEYTEDQLQDEDFRDHQQLRDRDERSERRERRRRSRDRSRTPKRRRRSRSRDRDRRRRSRSRERHRRSKSKERERKERERERERRKQGIPAVRGNFVTICTTTIWIGHLSKVTSQEDLKEEVERYGPVLNINLIPPRGCAYIVMEKRKDAFKTIERLKGQKINGSSLKTAWAQSTGMRNSRYKDSWDVDEGAIYIPWDNLPADMTGFLDGGIIDGESLPDHLKDIPTEKSQLDEMTPQQAMPTQEMTPAVMNMPSQVMPPQPQQQQQQQQPQQPQQPMMGMMAGNVAMGGMVPGMMVPMQRSMVPGMPPQPGLPALPPGAPPQMMQGTAPVPPGMPPVRPPGMLPPTLSMANNSMAANSLAQTVQNIMSTTSGVLSSPSQPTRPAGLTPGAAVPRFGFNPNMPPPGFRLPPPGFGGPLPPMLGGVRPGQPTDTPPVPPRMELPTRPLGPKQPEMMWPPDSNEMDEEDDEEEGGPAGNQEPGGPGQFGMPPRPGGPGQDNMMRMMGPGGFPPGGPPGPVNQPWNMRMGGPRGMRGMGPRGLGGPPDRFSSPRGGPRIGGPPFMPGGRFPRFGMDGPAPVSLLDLPDIRPKGNFAGQNFHPDRNDDFNPDRNNDFNEDRRDNEFNEDRNDNYNDENIEENQEGQMEEQEEQDKRGYPFNTWKAVKSGGRDRDNHKSNRDDGDGDERDHRNSRDGGERRDREERKDRGRDRDRTRKSRWGDPDDIQIEQTEPEMETQNIENAEVVQSQSNADVPSSEVPVSEAPVSDAPVTKDATVTENAPVTEDTPVTEDAPIEASSSMVTESENVTNTENYVEENTSEMESATNVQESETNVNASVEQSIESSNEEKISEDQFSGDKCSENDVPSESNVENSEPVPPPDVEMNNEPVESHVENIEANFGAENVTSEPEQTNGPVETNETHVVEESNAHSEEPSIEESNTTEIDVPVTKNQEEINEMKDSCNANVPNEVSSELEEGELSS